MLHDYIEYDSMGITLSSQEMFFVGLNFQIGKKKTQKSNEKRKSEKKWVFTLTVWKYDYM